MRWRGGVWLYALQETILTACDDETEDERAQIDEKALLETPGAQYGNEDGKSYREHILPESDVTVQHSHQCQTVESHFDRLPWKYLEHVVLPRPRYLITGIDSSVRIRQGRGGSDFYFHWAYVTKKETTRTEISKSQTLRF